MRMRGLTTAIVGASLGLAAAVLAVRRRRRSIAPAHALVNLVDRVLARCRRPHAAGVADVEKVREQIAALGATQRSLQLEQQPSVCALRAHADGRAAPLMIATVGTKLEEARELAAAAEAAPLCAERAPEDARCKPVSAELPPAEDTCRARLLADEEEALDVYIERAHTVDSDLARRLGTLARLIGRLRAAEEHLDVNAALLNSDAEPSARLGCGQASFPYGSMPYHSWFVLHAACPALATATRSCVRRGESIVLGSSLGWLCFYAALTYAIPSTGYEPDDPLASLARELASSFELAESCTFHAADMLAADLSAAKVVTLTSKGWDEPLCAEVRPRNRQTPSARACPVPKRARHLSAHHLPALGLLTLTSIAWPCRAGVRQARTRAQSGQVCASRVSRACPHHGVRNVPSHSERA